ncbi:unnamed protein product, partial [Closterium sp. Yama58-4]
FVAFGIKFVNTAGPENHQAVAFRATGDQTALFNCAFEGSQDTLYVDAGRQYYKNCYIGGTQDFIFGDAAVVIDAPKIQLHPSPSFGTLTASGRSKDTPTGIVIRDANVAADSGTSRVYLGRPWKKCAFTVFINANLPAVIEKDGWLSWNEGSCMFLAEAGSKGPGAASSRVDWAKPGIITDEFSFDVAGISHTYACSTRELLLTSLYNRLDEVNGIGTDFPVRKASNHRGEYTEVVLRVRSASLVKMVAAGVRHERQTASSMKKINLVDVMKIETAGERDEQVLLHTKSRVWQLLVDGESDQFASTVQRNAKLLVDGESDQFASTVQRSAKVRWREVARWHAERREKVSGTGRAGAAAHQVACESVARVAAAGGREADQFASTVQRNAKVRWREMAREGPFEGGGTMASGEEGKGEGEEPSCEQLDQVLLHTKSRVWQLLVDGESDQFASTVQRNAKVLVFTESRVWQLLVDGESDQFASTVQRNAKVRQDEMYLQKHIPVQRVTGEEILMVTNARAESLAVAHHPPLSAHLPPHQRASPVLYEFTVVKNNDPASGMQRERREFIMVSCQSPHLRITLSSCPMPFEQRASPVLYEFSVVKNNDPASGMQRERTLVLTKEFMAEMTGSHVIALHSLSDILGLVVSDKNESEVIVELSGWRATQYFVADREALVGSLAEVASHAKARNFSVRLEPFAHHTLPEKPLPLYQNEYEIYLIAHFMTVFLAHRENLSELTQADVVAQWLPMVKEYACNMHPGDSLCIDARPMLAVAEMLRASLDLKPGLGASYAVTCCSVVQRLLGTRGVFESVKSNPDFISILIKALKHPSSVVAFAAANTIRAAIKHYSADSPAPDSPAAARAATTSSFLMQAWPAHAEAANKHVVLSGDNLQVLVARLQTDALVHQNALQVQGILEILTLALNLPPSSDAEAEKHWMETLESSLLVAADVISAISRSRSNIMYCSNALLIKTIFTRCSPAFITRFRAVILSRAVVLLLLKNALFNKLERARDISAELLFLIAESDAKTQQLLANLLPKGFFFVLKDKTEAARKAELEEAAKAAAAGGASSTLASGLKVAAAVAAAAAAAAAAASTNTGTTPGSGTAGGEGSGGAVGMGGGSGGLGSVVALGVWKEALEMLRRRSITTPVLVWNDSKRHELHAYLKEQVEAFDAALGRTGGGKDIHFNTDDCECCYSPASNDNDVCKTIVEGVHLEVLLQPSDDSSPALAAHWKLDDPAALFTATLQALLLCFTPLYGTCELPEIEPRLAVDALTWMYERHEGEIRSVVENLHVVELFVAMLREAIDNDHVVFAFKSLLLLRIILERAGRPAVSRFVKAGGMSIILPLMVNSLAKCCKDETLFECDAPSVKDRGAIEVVPVVGADGEVRMARVPSGRQAKEGGASTVHHGGSVEARDAIKWQDESVPEKLQLGMALELLETVLDVIEVPGGLERYPPPLPLEDLARPELLCSLVQLLLRAKSPTFRRILEVLSILCRGNKQAASELHRYGCFPMLLWKVVAGDISHDDRTRILKFLARTHLLQDPSALEHAPVKGLVVVEHLPWHESILRLYLPAGLVSKLIQEGAELFLSNLDTEDIDTPEIVWNEDMKERLRSFLEADLQPYVQARAGDPHAVYVYEPKPPLVYPELAGTIFVAPVYLHNVLDAERFPAHQVFDSTSFHHSVLREYERILQATSAGGGGAVTWRQEAPRLVLLLKAQAVILDRYPQIPLGAEAESVVIDMATPALRVCIAQRDDCPPQMADILQHAAKILRGIAATRDKEGRKQLRDDVRWRKGFWWALCSAAGESSRGSADGVPCSLAFAALDCLNHFAGDRDMCYRLINQALHLPLLLLAVPSESTLEDERRRNETAQSFSPFHQSQPSKMSGAATKQHMIRLPASRFAQAGQEPNFRAKALQQVAAEVLRTLAITLEQALPPDGEPSPRGSLLHMQQLEQQQQQQQQGGLLSYVIPWGLLDALKNPDAGAAKLVALVGADGEMPTAIWNAAVREELRGKVEARIKRFNLVQAGGGAGGGAEEEDEVAWLRSFRYECLKDEMVISGIFVRGYAAGSWENFDLPDGRAFLMALQDYLRSSLPIISSQSSSSSSNLITPPSPSSIVTTSAAAFASQPPTVAGFLMVLKALAECIRYAVEDGKRGMLAHIDYLLLAEILAAAPDTLPTARRLVVGIAQIVSGAPTSREQLLGSSLLPVLARQLWRSVTIPGTGVEEGVVAPEGEEDFGAGLSELALAILDAVLDLSVEMAAVVAVTNHFSSSSLLLVLLALFLRVPLPPFKGTSKKAAGQAWSEAEEAGVLDTAQFRAAQILGQLLLAACGVQDRAKFIAGIEEEGVGSATALGDGTNGIDTLSVDDEVFSDPHGDVRDIHNLISLLEPGAAPAVPLISVRVLYLLLPMRILSLLMSDPEGACRAIGSPSCTPLLVWNDASARRARDAIKREAEEVLRRHEGEVSEGKQQLGLPMWDLEAGEEMDGGSVGRGREEAAAFRPFFLQYVRESIELAKDEGEGAAGAGEVAETLFSEQEKAGYVPEMYIGGCYVDQLLRQPRFDLGKRVELQLVREIRKAIVTAAPNEGKRYEEFTTADRRRLLLALLALFQSRPHLLTITNTDIFLPVTDFFTSGSGEERRALLQAGVLLFLRMVTSNDVADFVSSEELISLLSKLLLLEVPAGRQGQAATDPRVCALMLMQKLFRLSSKAVELGLQHQVVDRLASLVLDTENSIIVRARAAAVLGAMAGERRLGPEITRQAERILPESYKNHIAWKVGFLKQGAEEIGQKSMPALSEEIEVKTMRHLLKYPLPCAWWTTDIPEDGGMEGGGDGGGGEGEDGNSGPTAVVEAALMFPTARLDAWNDEVDGALRHGLAAAALSNTRNVRILRKKLAGAKGVLVEVELQFQPPPGAAARAKKGETARTSVDDPTKAARTFKQRLETQLGDPLNSFCRVAVRPAGLRLSHRQAVPNGRLRRADVGVRAAADANASATATDSRASELVDKLLSMVKDSDRGAAMADEGRAAVTAIVEQLEAMGLEEPLKSPLVFGAWEVAYTSRPTAAGGYYRSMLGRTLLRSKDLVQTIYPPNGVDNLVEFDALSLIPGSISLKGTFEPLDNKWVRAVFEAPNLALGPLKFSYGGQSSVRLSVSYLDERVRIGRGSQGSVFVFARRT